MRERWISPRLRVHVCRFFQNRTLHVASVHKWLVHNFLVENVGYLSILVNCCSFGCCCCCTHSCAPSLLAVVDLFFYFFIASKLLAQRRGESQATGISWKCSASESKRIICEFIKITQRGFTFRDALLLCPSSSSL